MEFDDPDTEEEIEAGELVLVFLAGGQAVLEEDDEQVWASDDDDDFREEFGNEFLTVDDAEEVLNYLEEEGLLEEEEKAQVEIEVESDADDEFDIVAEQDANAN